MTLARRMVGIVALIVAAQGSARADQLTMIYAPDGIALSGYDAVSYFTESRPAHGSPENAVTWRGATWYFESPQSESQFEMNPEAYAPQFGGYCAYSLSEGEVASGAPDAYVIYDGRLYLMHEADILAQKRGDLPLIVQEAARHWPAALGR